MSNLFIDDDTLTNGFGSFSIDDDTLTNVTIVFEYFLVVSVLSCID